MEDLHSAHVSRGEMLSNSTFFFVNSTTVGKESVKTVSLIVLVVLDLIYFLFSSVKIGTSLQWPRWHNMRNFMRTLICKM